MIGTVEDSRTEFKIKLVDDLEETVIGFLNSKDGGNIYIGVDDNGNIVGASTHGIPVDQYVEEHCTEEFQKDYQKYGLNIPLYDVKYNLHLWVYTNAANYVNDFNIEFTLNPCPDARESLTELRTLLTDLDAN